MLQKSLLNEFRLTVDERELGVYGIHVWQRGDELYHRWRSDDEVCLYSGSKTFTSIACGMCQDEGRLKLEDPWLEYFPEYREIAVPGTERQTLRALLHMQSGKRDCWPELNGVRTDWLELWAKQPLVEEPGTHFHYVNSCTYTVARVIEKVTGMTVREYLMPRLFEPADIYNPQWHTDPNGHSLGFSGLFLRTQDFAKVGRLMYQDGVWKDKQLVSAEYVHAMREDIADNSNWQDPESTAGYGYQIWRCTWPMSYRADGMYGQFSVVLPQQEAVVTINSHNEGCPNDILRALFEDVAPKL